MGARVLTEAGSRRLRRRVHAEPETQSTQRAHSCPPARSEPICQLLSYLSPLAICQ